MDLKSLALATLGNGPKEFAAAIGKPRVTVPPARDPGEPRYLETPELGLSVAIDESDAATCLQVYGVGTEKPYRKYAGDLLSGVALTSSRDQVRRVLGDPLRSDPGGPGKRLFGKSMRPWDIFLWEEWQLHFEYTEDASGVRLVSVTRR